MSARKDFVVEQGATFSKTVTLKTIAGAPIDISAYSPRGQVRKTHRSEDVEATFTFDTSHMAQGRLIIILVSDVTKSMVAGETESDIRGRYVYDIELWRTDAPNPDIVRRFLEGFITVSPEVTR